MRLGSLALAPRMLLACCVVAAVIAAAPLRADAASVAYIDHGEVWLSSLDGSQKARLAAPVPTSDPAVVEQWIDVAQSDNGRIVAARNVPGKISRGSSFRIWEPDGTSTVDAPLTAPAGYTTYLYPLGFDLSADGKLLVYGFSNTTSCCPMGFARGTYARPADNGVTDPLVLSGVEYPALVGSRLVAVGGGIIGVQESVGSSTFTPWLDTSGTGLEQRNVDVAANSKVAAFELAHWDGGTRDVGKIGVLAIQGLDAPPAIPAAVDCYLPSTGIAQDPSLSMDGATIAWDDADGLKVAGTPTTAADPCVLPSGPTVISPTGRFGSIGGADVAAFLPKPPPPPPGTGGTTGDGGTGSGTGTPAPSGGSSTPPPGGTPGTSGGSAAPKVALPARVTRAALARGLVLRVTVSGPGAVRLALTVPARRLGLRGKAVTVATGKARASRADTVRVRLRLTAVGRRRPARLTGARAVLRVAHGGSAVTRRLTVR